MKKRGKKQRAIIEILEKAKELGSEPLTAREIHDFLNDGTAPPSTHAALSRLIEDGDISEVGQTPVDSGHSAAQYALREGMAVQPKLFSFDIEPELTTIFGEGVSEVQPSLADPETKREDREDVLDLVASYTERISTYEDRRPALRRAAQKLVSINPRTLVKTFLLHLLETFREGRLKLQGGDLSHKETIRLEGRLKEIQEIFENVARTIGLPREIVELRKRSANVALLSACALDTEEGYRRMQDELAKYIDTVIFGEHFLNIVDDNVVEQTQRRIRTVTSSDGSIHPIALSGLSRLQSEYDSIDQAMTFNNAAGAYSYNLWTDKPFKYRFLPFSRLRIQQGIPEGIILGSFLYPQLSESEFAHLLRFVPDNIQWMHDRDALISGSGENIGDSWPVPNVHFRDGMGVPYERSFSHFLDDSPYGDHTRTGIHHYFDIVNRIAAAHLMGELLVVTGAVKDSRLRFFAYLIDWFISWGSSILCPDENGEPIDVEWPEVTAITLTDNKAMANLMAAAREAFSDPKGEQPTPSFTSFRVRREFAAIAEPGRPQQLNDQGIMTSVHDWRSYLEERRQLRAEDNQRRGFDAFADELEITPFVSLCEKADITLFYTSDTGGSPALGMPRYEFIHILKSQPQDKRPAIIDQCVNAILAGIKSSGDLDIDSDHNFMRDLADRQLTVLPTIMLEAHKAAKESGKVLSQEITTVIYENVAKRMNMNLVKRLQIRPISFADYSKIDAKVYKGLSDIVNESDIEPSALKRLRALGFNIKAA